MKIRNGRLMSRRRFLEVTASAAGALAASGIPTRALAYGTATVSSRPSQVMEGFGASGAWWPNDLVNFASARQQQVADMLFSPSGIGLSVYRYNIGGGGYGVTNPVRAPQTFLIAPGSYDYSRDPGGRLFLGLAAAAKVPILIGFVNSAPTYWTTNGLNCGGSLSSGAEPAFAGYLADITAHFQDAGTPFAYMSPMNEPDYTFAGGKQEGMAVPVAKRAVLVKAVATELASRALSTRVTADESSQVGTQFNPEAPKWMNVADTPQYVGTLAHHLYDFPSSFTLQQAAQIASSYGKQLWCSEVCCFVTSTGRWGQQYDPTIGNAVVMANLIWQCLTQANDAAFHWWTAVSSAMGCDPKANPASAGQVNSSGWNDGLLYYDPNYATNGNQDIYVSKRYYALGNFSRYVRPGDSRYGVSNVPVNLRMLAFANGGRWTLVVINTASAGSAATSFRLQMPVRVQPSFAVETSAVNNLGSVALPGATSGGIVSGSVPAQSITTLGFNAV
jgi:O-glycosyl hydrolase